MAEQLAPVLRYFCPDGGVTSVEKACPGSGGWGAVCSIHGDLGGASTAADCTPIFYAHAGVERPEPQRR